MVKTLDAISAWERPAVVSGTVAALLHLAAFAYFGAAAAPSMPPVGAPEAEHAAFYAQQWATLNVANYLYLLPIPFFLIFLGGMFASMQRAEGGVGALTIATLGAGLALTMTWPQAIIVAHTGQGMARHGLDAATVVAFDGVAQHGLALSGFPRAVLLGGLSILLLRTPGKSRWLGWIGLGLAAMTLLGSLTLVLPLLYPAAALAAVFFNLWLLALSGVLLGRLSSSPTAGAARSGSVHDRAARPVSAS